MCNIDDIEPNQLVILGALISAELANGKTATEVNVLGNLVASVGASLLTIAAQMQSIEEKNK